MKTLGLVRRCQQRLLLPLVLLWSCGTGEVSYEGSSQALQSGWTLFSASSDDASLFEGLVEGRWAAWAIEQVYNPEIGRFERHYVRARTLRPDLMYWVYVAPEGEDVHSAFMSVPETLPQGNDWGQFLHPSLSVSLAELGALRAYAWSVPEQRLVPVTSGALKQGQSYWVEYPQSCDPGAWRLDDAGVQAPRCPLEGGRSVSGQDSAVASMGKTATATRALDADDLWPPLIRIAHPPREEVYSKHPSIVLKGEVYDERMVAFSVNGVVLGHESQSFEQAVWLEPGLNRVTVSAIDAAGRQTRVTRRVHFDNLAPRIELSVPEPNEIAAADLIRIHGTVTDATLTDFRINGQPVDVFSEHFVYGFSKSALASGLQVLEFVAVDAAKNLSRRLVGLFVDEHGSVFVPKFGGLDHHPSPDIDAPVGFFIDAVSPEPGTDFDVVVTDPSGGVQRLAFSSLIEGGASSDWQRAHVYFSDLPNIQSRWSGQPSAEAVEVENISPKGVDLGWKVTYFGAEEFLRSPGSDVSVPALFIDSPGPERLYTNIPLFSVLGHVQDDHLQFVRINEVIVATATGAFQSVVELPEGESIFRIVARDAAEHEAEHIRRVVLDRDPPAISLRGKNRETVYGPEYVLEGLVVDAHLDQVTLVHAQHASQFVQVDDHGRFSVSVDLSAGENPITLQASDRAHNVASQEIVVTYRPEGFVSATKTLAPHGVIAWADGGKVFLRWKAPTHLEDGTQIPNGTELKHRVYHNGKGIQIGEALSHETTVPYFSEKERFHVTTLIPSSGGDFLESKRSNQIELSLEPPALPLAEETFETPSAVTVGAVHAALPAMAISQPGDDHSGPVYTHMAYVLRGGSEDVADRIEYQRSEKFAKLRSWQRPRGFETPNGSRRVAELALAARGERVAVVWTATSTQPDAQGMQAYVATSVDGGFSFSEPSLLRKSPSWIRGIDLEFDARGVNHLVFGEGGKAFYAKDFSVEALNVFDVKVRTEATEVVRYKGYYEPVDGHCVCPDCWCEESYPVSGAPDPENPDQTLGPYLERIEEAYVYMPSLFVGDDGVTIIARQRRMWDNKSVPHPAWFEALENPVYSETVVQRLVPTKLVVGWRETWKKAYEPGDEDLVADLGGAFQYRYEGQWYEQDQIKVAQRPHQDGTWPDQGTDVWKDNVEQSWRRSVVDDDWDASFADAPSRPRVLKTPSGQMVAVFEKGPSSNPNVLGSNPIHVSYSDDGGVSWSASKKVATGYVPDMAVSSTGDLGMVYYAPGAGPDDAEIVFLRDTGDGRWDEVQSLNHRPPRSVHSSNHGQGSDRLYGVPSLVAHETLFIAAWVRQAGDGRADQVVLSRGGRPVLEERAVEVTVPSEVVVNQNASVSLECVNQYHMQTSNCGEDGPVHLLGGASVASEALEGFDRSRTVSVEFGVGTGGGTALGLVQSAQSGGQELAGASGGLKPAVLEVGAAALSSVEPLGGVGFGALQAASASEVSGELQETVVLSADARGNYLKAKSLVDGLYDPISGAQREYAADVSEADTTFLARYGRVWAYGQGIALAQYSRNGGERAERLADYICRTAVILTGENGEQTLGGWHFSTNTFLDTWKDQRLVTGANAWVIHGLGAFMVSEVFSELPQDRRNHFYQCYMDGLYGLMQHFEPGVDLMTAGWTTQGLKYANTPGEILDVSDPSLSWAYYDILDAVGYDIYNPLKPPAVETLTWDENDEAELVGVHLVTVNEFLVLQQRAKATNVVTEHNLDTLSVINHLLKHWDQIARSQPDDEQNVLLSNRYEKEQWTAFRDRLNQAIFTELWNEADGRVVTGGELVDGRLERNPFSAIDNCSWLSLSVHYGFISEDEREKLARCLDYTVDTFAKELSYRGFSYYGAHYFPKGFKDRYIEANEDQEKLYHLEATTGLILGLLYFVDANPLHARSPYFQEVADRLWREMQNFVRDHNFPYSTHRIQDLKSRLQSNTSAIWFIDVYDYYAARDIDLDRPLKNYAEGLDILAARTLAQEGWARVKNSEGDDFENEETLRVTGAAQGDLGAAAWAELGASAPMVEQVVNGLPTTYRFSTALDGLRQQFVDGRTWSSVPVNVTDIELVVRTEKRPSGSFSDAFGEYFWPTHWVFEGKVLGGNGRLSGLPESYAVLLSTIAQGEERLVDFAKLKGTGTSDWRFETSMKAPSGDASLPPYAVARLVRLNVDTEQYELFAATGGEADRTSSGRAVYFGFQGQWFFHQGTEAPNATYRLVQRGDGTVLEEAKPSTQSRSFLLSLPSGSGAGGSGSGSSSPSGGQSVTLVQDQALAILAALASGDMPRANRWADALLATRMVSPSGAGGGLAQFPFAVRGPSGEAVAPYYETGTQLLVIHALAEFGIASGSRAQQKTIFEALNPVLSSVQTHYPMLGVRGLVARGSGERDVMASALRGDLDAEPGDLGTHGSLQPWPVAALQDQVFGFFAARSLRALAENAYGADHAHVSSARVAMERFSERVDHFWRDEQPRVFAWAAESGVEYSGTSLGAVALYILYAEAQGGVDLERRKHAYRLLSLLDDGTSEELFGGSISERALAALARRVGATALDPRLEQLAWLDYGRLATMPRGGLSDAAIAVLVEDPRGFLGVRAPEMFFIDPLPMGLQLDPALADARLDAWYYSALFAVLASDGQPYVFETLLKRLVQLHFATKMVKEGVPETQWAQAYYKGLYGPLILETIHEMTHLCEGFSSVLGGTAKDIEQNLGVPCTAASEEIQKQVTVWSGDDVRATWALVDHQDDRYTLTRLIHALREEAFVPKEAQAALHFGFPRTSELVDAHGFVRKNGPISLDDAGPLDAERLRSDIRANLDKALRQGVSAQTGNGLQVLYDLRDIDFISLTNPAAPEHWGREGFELRQLQHVDAKLNAYSNGHLVRIDLDGLLYGRPEPALSEDDRAENTRQLVILLGGGAGPDGIRLAMSNFGQALGPVLGLQQGHVARYFDEGVVAKRHVEALAFHLGLDAEATEAAILRFTYGDMIGRGEMRENARQLRRFINFAEGGDLPTFSARTGLTPARVHHMLAEGKLTALEFQQMAAGLQLTPESAASWEGLFVFTPLDSLAQRLDRISATDREALASPLATTLPGGAALATTFAHPWDAAPGSLSLVAASPFFGEDGVSDGAPRWEARRMRSPGSKIPYVDEGALSIFVHPEWEGEEGGGPAAPYRDLESALAHLETTETPINILESWGPENGRNPIAWRRPGTDVINYALIRPSAAGGGVTELGIPLEVVGFDLFLDAHIVRTWGGGRPENVLCAPSTARLHGGSIINGSTVMKEPLYVAPAREVADHGSPWESGFARVWEALVVLDDLKTLDGRRPPPDQTLFCAAEVNGEDLDDVPYKPFKLVTNLFVTLSGKAPPLNDEETPPEAEIRARIVTAWATAIRAQTLIDSARQFGIHQDYFGSEEAEQYAAEQSETWMAEGLAKKQDALTEIAKIEDEIPPEGLSYVSIRLMMQDAYRMAFPDTESMEKLRALSVWIDPDLVDPLLALGSAERGSQSSELTRVSFASTASGRLYTATRAKKPTSAGAPIWRLGALSSTPGDCIDSWGNLFGCVNPRSQGAFADGVGAPISFIADHGGSAGFQVSPEVSFDFFLDGSGDPWAEQDAFTVAAPGCEVETRVTDPADKNWLELSVIASEQWDGTRVLVGVQSTPAIRAMLNGATDTLEAEVTFLCGSTTSEPCDPSTCAKRTVRVQQVGPLSPDVWVSAQADLPDGVREAKRNALIEVGLLASAARRAVENKGLVGQVKLLEGAVNQYRDRLDGSEGECARALQSAVEIQELRVELFRTLLRLADGLSGRLKQSLVGAHTVAEVQQVMSEGRRELDEFFLEIPDVSESKSPVEFFDGVWSQACAESLPGDERDPTSPALVDENTVPDFEFSFEGWVGGAYRALLSADEMAKLGPTPGVIEPAIGFVPQSPWKATQPSNSWVVVTPDEGGGGDWFQSEETVKFSIEMDRAWALEPRAEPYVEFVHVVSADDSDSRLVIKILLFQRGVPESHARGFRLPPGMSWCADGPAADVGEVLCREARPVLSLCGPSGCSHPERVTARWLVNGRAISGFDPHVSLSLPWVQGLTPIVRRTDGIEVLKEAGKLEFYEGGLLQDGPWDLRFTGYAQQSNHGELHVVTPHTKDTAAVSQQWASSFDAQARVTSERLGLDVAPYTAFVLPEAMFAGAREGVFGHHIPSRDEGLAGKTGIIISDLRNAPQDPLAFGAGASVRPLEPDLVRAFTHEYVHWLHLQYPDLSSWLPPGFDRVCVFEGVATAVTSVVLSDPSLLDPRRIEQGYRLRCSDNDDTTVGERWMRGICAMWHVSQDGHFSQDYTDAFLRGLFHAKRAMDVDTCDFEDPRTGNAWVVYLSEAASEAAGEPLDLSQVVTNMGGRHAGSYEKALEALGYKPIVFQPTGGDDCGDPLNGGGPCVALARDVGMDLEAELKRADEALATGTGPDEPQPTEADSTLRVTTSARSPFVVFDGPCRNFQVENVSSVPIRLRVVAPENYYLYDQTEAAVGESGLSKIRHEVKTSLDTNGTTMVTVCVEAELFESEAPYETIGAHIRSVRFVDQTHQATVEEEMIAVVRGSTSELVFHHAAELNDVFDLAAQVREDIDEVSRRLISLSPRGSLYESDLRSVLARQTLSGALDVLEQTRAWTDTAADVEARHAELVAYGKTHPVGRWVEPILDALAPTPFGGLKKIWDPDRVRERVELVGQVAIFEDILRDENEGLLSPEHYLGKTPVPAVNGFFGSPHLGAMLIAPGPELFTRFVFENDEVKPVSGHPGYRVWNLSGQDVTWSVSTEHSFVMVKPSGAHTLAGSTEGFVWRDTDISIDRDALKVYLGGASYSSVSSLLSFHDPLTGETVVRRIIIDIADE